jgi:hypothetical protein
MNHKEVLADLREQYEHLKGKVYLKPLDLVPVLGISEGQQANLRSQGRFNIPLQNKSAGLGVCVSIFDLAKYIADPSAFLETKSSPKKKARILTFWQEVDHLTNQAKSDYEYGALDESIPKSGTEKIIIVI